MAKLHDFYKDTVVADLQKKFGYKSVMQVPRIEKITLNMGVGEAISDKKVLEHATNDLTAISGQKPITTVARKSVAGFKIREGYAVGCKVTLRRKNMWEFLDRMISFAIPQIRDFRGLSPKGFDGRGNYSFGLSEQIVFPEISADREHMHGMNIVVVTTAATDNEGRELLRLLGFPFRNLDVVQVASSAKA